MSESNAPRPLISIVVPAMNEADNLEALYSRVKAVFDGALSEYDWELVVTDNRSTDNTFEILEDLAQRDSRVRAYRFSRNFGYQRSIFTGYMLANGDAVVQLDADMQDRPELIPELVERWAAGANVVYGVRIRRANEAKMLTAARKLFYRLIDWLSEESLPRDAGDFRLVDRVVVELLRHTHDSSPYLRGTIASMGFEQVGFEYERDDRVAGETKFSFKSLVELAVDGILNHSTRPLHLASLTAVVVVMVSVVGIAAYLVAKGLFGQDWPAGFASLALLQLVTILLNAAFLGIIGAYIGRMFKQEKRAPFVVIDKTAGVETPPSVLTSSDPVTTHALIVNRKPHHE